MSQVIIQECNNYELTNLISKINSGIMNLGGWDKFVKSGDKVLLKVNLIGPKLPESAAVTHCEFVRALVRILKDKGCTVWIGDSAGGAIAGIAPTAQALKVAGFQKMSEEEGAVIKNFDIEGVVEVSPKGKFNEKMYLAKPMFEADVVINLPKLKTHSASIYTGAVKNLFGCIPGLRKAKYHKIAPNPIDLGEIITDIHEARKVDLHIMDGIIGMQGEGPTAGKPYEANKIIMSKDPLALDVVAATMMGLKLEDIPILLTANKRELGQGDMKKITIKGDYTSIPRLKNYRLPKRLSSNKTRNYNSVVKVIDFFKTKPKINMKKCKSCNMCVESCPVEAISLDSKSIDYDLCIECMCCHELCLHKAVDLKKDNPVARVLAGISMGKYR